MSDPSSLSAVERWSSLRTYNPGDVVLWDGLFYVARSTTNATPGPDAPDWVAKAEASRKPFAHDGVQA